MCVCIRRAEYFRVALYAEGARALIYRRLFSRRALTWTTATSEVVTKITYAAGGNGVGWRITYAG